MFDGNSLSNSTGNGEAVVWHGTGTTWAPRVAASPNGKDKGRPDDGTNEWTYQWQW
jgi:hypothetical protein